MKAGIAALLVLLAPVGRPAPPPQCPVTPRTATEIGTRELVIEHLAASPGVVTPYPASPQQGARYLRARVEVAQPPDCDWLLTVRDQEYRLIQTFGRRDFSTAGQRWTYRINGQQVLFDLQPCADGRQPTIRLGGYVWMPEAATNTYYSLQGATEAFHPITRVDSSLRRLGDVTGLLMSSFVKDSWSCSGVMITPELFLTNWHCGGPGHIRASGPAGGTTPFPSGGYWSPEIVADTVIDLSWDGDGISRELAVTEVVARSEPLDFALLRTVEVDRRGPIRPVKLASAAPAAGDLLTIVHHPAARTKQVSSGCQAVDADYGGWRDSTVRSDFTHLCDTEAGSSGAPVFNARLELVGLHHLGFDYDGGTCRYRDHENKAIKIAAIIEHVRTSVPSIYQEVMTWQR